MLNDVAITVGFEAEKNEDASRRLQLSAVKSDTTGPIAGDSLSCPGGCWIEDCL